MVRIIVRLFPMHLLLQRGEQLDDARAGLQLAKRLADDSALRGIEARLHGVTSNGRGYQ